jgi:hypothetical protein
LRKFVLALALSVVPAYSQTVIRYFPSHPPADGSIPQVCLDEGSALKTELARFPHPDTWTFVIACDDHAWDDLMALSGHAGYGRGIFGATNPDNHSTLLRGRTLLGKDREMTPEHLVAHELAHIYLHSSDERRVEDRAFDWMKQHRLVLAANGGAE